MSVSRMALVFVLVATAAIIGCKPALPGSGSGGGNNNGSAASPDSPAAVMTEKLTEAEIKKHLDVLRGLQDISDDAKTDPTGIQRTAEVNAYMASKGTTWEEFGRIHMKVLSAFMAMGFRDGIAKAKAEGAPAAAITMMEMAGAAYKDVPDENVELARKYKDDLDKLNVKEEE